MNIYTRLVLIFTASLCMSFSLFAAPAAVERVHLSYGECIQHQEAYYPTISRPMNNGSRITMAQAGYQKGDCAFSTEVVNAQRQLVEGWVFLPSHFEIVKHNGKLFMWACSNALTEIGAPSNYSPPAPYQSQAQPQQPQQPQPIQTGKTAYDRLLARETARSQGQNLTLSVPTLAAVSGSGTSINSGGGNVRQGVSGTAVVVGAAVVGGLVYLAGRDKKGNTINNNGTCAGATVAVNGNQNATCGSSVTTPSAAPTPVVCASPNTVVNGVCTTPAVCALPNRLIGTVCTTPPVCNAPSVVNWSGSAFSCVCVSPNRVFSSGVCEVPRQCNAGETLGLDNICRANQCPQGQQVIGGFCQVPVQCRNDQISVNNVCQCPVGQQTINGVCQVPVQVCTISGQIVVGNTCQCPQGQQVIGGFCQVPVLVCTTGPIVGNVCTTCPSGQQFDGLQCRCPNNGQIIGNVCQIPPPVCTTSGQIVINNVCQCPVGQQVIGGVCQVPVQFCATGPIVGNVCTTCPAGTIFDGMSCRISNG